MFYGYIAKKGFYIYMRCFVCILKYNIVDIMKVIVCVCVLVAVASAHLTPPDARKVYADLAHFTAQLKFDPDLFFNAIVPGTKWCGDGDIAENDDDLGFFKETDKCCRAHDKCDDFIPSGGSKHGLENNGPFTRLHCTCDDKFYKCLKDQGDKLVSGAVGTGYFNALGGQCYKKTPPATCVKYDTMLHKRCMEYSYDASKPEEWQWFDVPKYIEIH